MNGNFRVDDWVLVQQTRLHFQTNWFTERTHSGSVMFIDKYFLFGRVEIQLIHLLNAARRTVYMTPVVRLLSRREVAAGSSVKLVTRVLFVNISTL